jgi:hypothetical protein
MIVCRKRSWMTTEDIRSELHKLQFVPFRLHLVSGKTVDVIRPDGAEILQNAVLVFQIAKTPGEDVGYDLISLRNIERVEQMKSATAESR